MSSNSSSSSDSTEVASTSSSSSSLSSTATSSSSSSTSSTVPTTSTTSSTTSSTSSVPVTTSSTSSSSSSVSSSTSSSTSPSSTSSSTSLTSSSVLSTTSSTSSSVFTTATTATRGTTTITVTSTSTPIPSSTTSVPASSTSADTGLNTGTSSAATGGLSGGARTAVAVVVPIVGVALLALAGIWLWRRRKQRKDAEELRRKEVEDYGYNPNNDPTLPAVAGVVGAQSGDGPYEMREDASGYRGWGTTVAGSSTGRKASTTMSAGLGTAYSDGTSPTRGADARSGDPLMGQNGRPVSDESESLGVFGPAAATNRNNGDINRGPSNASSSYSAANRSDGSGEQNLPGGAHGQAQYYSGDGGYSGAYGDGPYAGPPGGRAEVAGQPVIRDNLARRATRIENPSHFPTQASSGIAQNF